MAAKKQRIFATGEEVRVKKKSRIVDQDRALENIAPENRVPIDQVVTGVQGMVCSEPYASPMKDGEYCVPIKLANDAVIGVPESRLERVSRTPRLERSGEGGHSPVSEETVNFWRDYFRQRGEIEDSKEE
ncbi:MAG: hypothetical protein ACREDF_08485 [Thermoplasmata archaeon]